MTRANIIRMAQEAEQPAVACWLAYEIDFLERFATLVAAAEREACVSRAGIALLGCSRATSDAVRDAIRARSTA